MKRLIIIIVGILIVVNGMAATHYVVTNGTPGWIGAADPYTNWATAGTNIIDVVNAALTNATPRIIWVTNGTYYLTNGVNISGALTIQSVNGSSNTIINGNYPALSNYCFYVNCSAGSTGVIDGFTITNFCFTNRATIYLIRGKVINCLVTGNRGKTAFGQSDGGGIYISDYGDVTNCVIRANTVNRYGGGVHMFNHANVWNTLIEGNTVEGLNGGGVFMSVVTGSLSNCVVRSNNAYGDGGGIACVNSGNGRSILSCVITSNTALTGRGGGIYLNSSCVDTTLIANCAIQGNSATNSGGGVYGYNFLLRNSLVAGNTALTNSAGGVWARTGMVENCTIASNYAAVSGGGLYIDTDGSGTNNIVYFNTAGVSANNFTNTAGNTGLHYSCVIPAVEGTRNITDDPSLVNLNGGDYRLKGNSPCVNAGLNQSWMTNAIDLEGRSRIRYGTVDMGAYERINAGVIYTVH